MTTTNIIRELFLPSLLALLVPLAILTMRYKSDTQAVKSTAAQGRTVTGISRPFVTREARRERRTMLAIGLGGMVFVPIFKTLTHLPPYMGMMLVGVFG
ncbi:MAG: sodium:proton antiporter [Spirosoma sp.]|nr:sodium:proton antiporter [Spirosoma sp.]